MTPATLRSKSAQPETRGDEPVAWLYEVYMGGDHWSQHYTDARPAGNKWQRNIRPLYLAAPQPSPRLEREAVLDQAIAVYSNIFENSGPIDAENVNEIRRKSMAAALDAILALLSPEAKS